MAENPSEVLIPHEQTDIDFLITADFAEVVNGKLYVMGGGWSNIKPPQYPAPVAMGIVVGLRVPYLESNRQHHITVLLRNGDGAELLKIEGDLETGRPPGARGESILVPLAVNGNFVLPGPTLLEVVASIGDRTRRLAIRVG